MTTIIKYLFALVLLFLASFFSELIAQKSIAAQPLAETIKIDGDHSEAIHYQEIIKLKKTS